MTILHYCDYCPLRIAARHWSVGVNLLRLTAAPPNLLRLQAPLADQPTPPPFPALSYSIHSIIQLLQAPQAPFFTPSSTSSRLSKPFSRLSRPSHAPHHVPISVRGPDRLLHAAVWGRVRRRTTPLSSKTTRSCSLLLPRASSCSLGYLSLFLLSSVVCISTHSARSTPCARLPRLPRLPLFLLAHIRPCLPWPLCFFPNMTGRPLTRDLQSHPSTACLFNPLTSRHNPQYQKIKYSPLLHCRQPAVYPALGVAIPSSHTCCRQ